MEIEHLVHKINLNDLNLARQCLEASKLPAIPVAETYIFKQGITSKNTMQHFSLINGTLS